MEDEKDTTNVTEVPVNAKRKAGRPFLTPEQKAENLKRQQEKNKLKKKRGRPRDADEKKELLKKLNEPNSDILASIVKKTLVPTEEEIRKLEIKKSLEEKRGPEKPKTNLQKNREKRRLENIDINLRRQLGRNIPTDK